jgi:hypothetical protein
MHAETPVNATFSPFDRAVLSFVAALRAQPVPNYMKPGSSAAWRARVAETGNALAAAAPEGIDWPHVPTTSWADDPAWIAQHLGTARVGQDPRPPAGAAATAAAYERAFLPSIVAAAEEAARRSAQADAQHGLATEREELVTWLRSYRVDEDALDALSEEAREQVYAAAWAAYQAKPAP